MAESFNHEMSELTFAEWEAFHELRPKVRVPAQAELEAVRQLRHEVLDPARLEPIELTLGTEDSDRKTIHVAAFAGKRVVSTVRLDSLEDGIYSVRKMATAQKFRGQQIGTEVLRFAEALAYVQGRAQGFTLDAREKAVPFFERNGYDWTGELVTHDDGVLNFTMTKRGLI
jgi:predicted GNAT family N-acyltransferase